jgi:serine/threonine protein kinase/tetratricopeptide (TPR) repeat protein
MSQSSHDFLGTERFRIRRRLGSGGMGVVYEAHDRETDKLVALKTLTRAEASHISRFKNEFRSLADVSHPNLVALYEFMVEGQYWFFTMELVKGVNFLEHVRPGYQARRRQSSKTPTLLKSTQAGSPPELLADYEAETRQLDSISASDADEDSAERTGDSLLEKSKLDLGRLSVALRQLAEGLHGLHETGKLHRDIKPSNVLVTNEGRVVILDFGLVAEVEGKELHDSVTLAGTPDYMSPEQGAQLPISRASDWYSIGVMLYQALTGRLPFSGKFFEVMMNKQNFDPPAPVELVNNVPPDLNDLCVRLLRRKPEERPNGREVLRILGHGKTGPLQRPIMSAPAPSSALTAAFVGRERQMRQLNEAFAFTRSGQTVTVYLHGSSGMGKTALARHFLDELRTREPEVVILEGRCYERESVPYKALDGVVDSLTKYLLSLPEVKAEALMPREVLALARLFPVMLQVDAVFNAPQREHDMPDPFTLRRKAFAALRELLARISDRQPLVLYIDDLQWSDADSTTLLEDLLRPPDSPPLLLLSSFRTEDLEAKPFLKALLEKTGTDSSREVYVGALSKSESYDMLDHLLGPASVALAQFADAMLGEARGNPFLLEQLARYALTSDQTATTGITLAMMLDARLSHLPKDARAFVDALAVAGRPINPEVIYQAAELSGDELQLIGSLRAAQFIRAGNGHTFELYHDRIRETLASQLSPTKVTQIHKRLAHAIESRGIDDPEALFEHYVGAGERVRAATHAAAAARKAASALAFDRAAAFYRRALELAPARGAELVDLKRGLAEALANAGRPAEAAEAYLEVAQLSSAAHSLDFRRRAAQQLLMGGHIKEGLELIRSVLAAVGFTLPAGPRRALFSLLLKRLQIKLRGLNFTERDASQIPEADLVRIDTCWAVAAGLGAVDLIRGADFQSRHLLLALKAGEPYRVARAMSFEAAQTVSAGGKTKERAMQIARRAEELSQKVGHPHAIGLSIWARGVSAYLVGEWKLAAELCERAAEVLRDRCTGVTWELTMANRFMLSALLYLGELAEVSRRVPSLLSSALEQGNVFAATDLRTRMNSIWLAADDPNKARAEVIEALKAWPHEGFHLQHYSSLLALAQIELYTGDADVAWNHIMGQWAALENSMLLRTQVLRIEATYLRARAVLATALNNSDAAKLRFADGLALKIEKENMPWAKPFAVVIRAAVAHQRGQQTVAITLLATAGEGFERADMRLYAAASRRRLGELLRDDRGRQLITEADAWMTTQRIKNPERMARMLVPGF